VGAKELSGAEIWRQKALLYRGFSAVAVIDNAVVTVDYKGYVTEVHTAALTEHGPCPIHRRRFVNVRRALGEDVRDVGASMPGDEDVLVDNARERPEWLEAEHMEVSR